MSMSQLSDLSIGGPQAQCRRRGAERRGVPLRLVFEP